MGVLFALCWSLVWAGSLALVAIGIVAMSLGECLYDSIQGPLVSDLAPQDLLGRYMAVSGFSWQLGFIMGPRGLAGLVLGAEPNALWPLVGGLSLAGAAYALVLERRLLEEVRRTSGEARRARRRAAPRAAAALRRR